MKIFSCLLLLLFSSKFAFSQPLEQIIINGLDSISRGTVLEYLPFEVGDEYEAQSVIKAEEILNNLGIFEQVRITIDSNKLTVNVKENPVIKFFEFKGYKLDQVLSEKLIDDLLSNFKLKPGNIFNNKSLTKLLDQLKIIYQDSAYFNSDIEIKFDKDLKNRIGVELIFSEGEPALISSLKINGSSYFEVDDLYDLLEIGEPDFFIINYFTERDHYSKPKLEAGIEKIKSKYIDQGYLDVSVTLPKLIFNKKDNSVNIEISIIEGNSYVFGSISVDGDILGLSNEKLLSEFDFQIGQRFSRLKLVNGVKKIGAIYENNGFAYANIKTDISILENTVNTKVTIKPDNRIYIDRIEISGNTRTQDEVVRRKLSLLEGERYTKDKISDSINSIKRLGYFSSVNHQLIRSKTNKDKANLIINVEETKTGEISVGLSHSSSTGTALNAGIQQTNILDTGNTLNASLTSSEAYEEISLYFKNPYVNELGHSISFGVFDKSLDASQIDTTSYTLNETGILFGYGVPFSSTSDVFGELRFSDINLTCGSVLALYESSECNSPSNLDAQFSLTFSNNSLNDFYNPTDGSNSILSTKIGTPIGDYNYFQLEGSRKDYSLINDRYTLKLSGRFKYGTGYNDDELPFFKRYHEGGTSSIRGFNFNSLGSTYPNNEPKGGEFSLVSSIGIASPVDFMGIDNGNMKVFGFLDGGSINDQFSDFDPQDIRLSTGIGFTWLTPIGPIGGHFAKPLVQKTGDQTETFSFSLGSSF